MTLAAIDRTVFAATIVDTFLYDTEKDSDGGAWRKRCAHTSWEAETLSGNWLGSAANEAAARAISGATTGSYYYDTTALGFYTLNAGSGKTATYRGNVRQFPAKVLITVEAARVVLWDLTQAGCPMWMMFATNGVINWPTGAPSMSSAAMVNGVLALVGVSTFSGSAVLRFVKDDMQTVYGAAYSLTSSRRISARNGATTYAAGGDCYVVAHSVIYDVAMTVLPNAPIDVATGLPIPTIAVATNGGVSVIQNDGTVANLTTTMGSTMYYLAIHKGEVFFSPYAPSLAQKMWHQPLASVATKSYTASDHYYASAVVPSVCNFYYDARKVSAGKSLALSGNTAIGTVNDGFRLLLANVATPASGMVSWITKDYNSGWQVGDIKGAWLADTVAETLTGTELVTNGTFATNTTGWTSPTGTLTQDTTVFANGGLKLQNIGGYDYAYQAITTVVGKTYLATAGFNRNGSSTRGNLSIGVAAGGATLGYHDDTINASGTLQVTFVATTTTTYVSAYGNVSGSTHCYYDNISCRLADVDRSVKAKGLQAFGSLTKAAVASGAALMGYSGFSAANYLEQPYNSDLDFGTGDFCYMGWVNTADVAGPVFCRNDGSARSVTVGMFTTNNLRLVVGATTVSGSIGIETSTWRFVVAGRLSGVGYLYVDAALIGSGAAADNVTQANAKLNIGHDPSGGWGQLSSTMSLLRASATFPTAEQIKHTYETEKPMFEANAQCCLAGTSNAVTALAYDDETDLLHVGTSYGRSAFKGLVRVSSEATAVGAITALSASAGVIVQGGATAVDVYVPAYTLREELLRDAEQMAKFGQNLIAHDFTATASQEVFTLPVGWEIVAVYQQGTLKRETTAWVRTFDGFKWSVDLVTGATVSDWISILAKRV